MSPVTRSAPSLLRMPLRALLGVVAASTIAVLAGAALPAQAVALEPAPGETVTVDFPFRADGEQYTWVVPDGVTEITIELAAGSGRDGELPDGNQSVGGVGGHVVATLTVESGDTLTLLVGGQGARTSVVGGVTAEFPTALGGGASAVSSQGNILIAAGGGGAGFACGIGSPEFCSDGGAGGLSLTSGSTAGRDGDVEMPVDGIVLAGTGATDSGPGTNAPTDFSAPFSGAPMTVVEGVIVPALGGYTFGDRIAGGGSGYFGGGHGNAVAISPTTDADGFWASGGGGGGSGYLVEGAEIIELRDNVGDGFASISYVVPGQEVVADPEPEPRTSDPQPEADPEPELIDTTEPTLTVSAATVRAGTSLDLAGTGLDPNRAYPVILNSDPVLLGDVTTDAQGAFATTVTIPASVHPGEHVITVGAASIPITVLAADIVPQPRMAPPAPELAATGPADDLAASGVTALTLLGLGALLLRRARQSEHV